MKDDFRTQAIIQELVRRANESSRRLRMIEQRIEAFDIKQNSYEESVNDKIENLNAKIKDIEVKVNDSYVQIIKFKSNLNKINKQIESLATRRELKEIEKMFELLSPIRNREYEEMI